MGVEPNATSVQFTFAKL